MKPNSPEEFYHRVNSILLIIERDRTTELQKCMDEVTANLEKEYKFIRIRQTLILRRYKHGSIPH
jgi:hypothetical protein